MHLGALGGEQVGDGVTDRDPPPAAGVQRAGRVGRHELEVDAPAGEGVRGPVAVALLHHLAQDVREPRRGEEEVEEARPRRSRPGRDGATLRRLERGLASRRRPRGVLPARLLGQRQGDRRGPVAVVALLGRLQHDAARGLRADRRPRVPAGGRCGVRLGSCAAPQRYTVSENRPFELHKERAARLSSAARVAGSSGRVWLAEEAGRACRNNQVSGEAWRRYCRRRSRAGKGPQLSPLRATWRAEGGGAMLHQLSDLAAGRRDHGFGDRAHLPGARRAGRAVRARGRRGRARGAGPRPPGVLRGPPAARRRRRGAARRRRPGCTRSPRSRTTASTAR